MLKKNHKKELL
ncbi:UNVERIFIED_CONTAM: hypothetical protein GTU68_006918 [Idotea baltica]|nr:hypothetical protein [Idotea baltica]